jgi:putative copper resistance protein D
MFASTAARRVAPALVVAGLVAIIAGLFLIPGRDPAAVPDAPSAGTLLTGWVFDPTVVLLVGAGGVLYLTGIRVATARGRGWRPARATAFFAGLAVLVVALLSPVARYDTALFSVHVVQHMLLSMAVPLLLAGGAPVTLALQTLPRRAKARLLGVLHSRVVQLVTHPVPAWMLFGGSLVLLYFTPLYEASLQHAWVHRLVHAHFLLAGCLFFWPIVGIDPVRPRFPYGARILAVLLAIPFHAFLGIALMSADRVLAEAPLRDWGPSPLADQRTGGAILWGGGDLLALAVVLVVLAQWLAAEDRAGRRHDAREDAR